MFLRRIELPDAKEDCSLKNLQLKAIKITGPRLAITIALSESVTLQFP